MKMYTHWNIVLLLSTLVLRLLHPLYFLQTASLASSISVYVCSIFIFWTNIRGWADACAMGQVGHVVFCDIIMHMQPCVIACLVLQWRPSFEAIVFSVMFGLLYMFHVKWNPRKWYEPSRLSNLWLVSFFLIVLMSVYAVMFIILL